MDFRAQPLNQSDRRRSVLVRSLLPSTAARVQRNTSLLRCSLLGWCATRQDNLWRALVAVPLAITAAVLAGEFWLVLPLALLAWWWGSREWGLAWLVGVMEACFGVQWGYVGAYALATYPHHRALVGALWIGYAALVAGVGAVNRWHYNRKSGW